MVPLVLFLTSCHQEENNKSILKDTKVEQRTEDCIDENDELEFCLGAQFQPKTIVLNNVPGYPSSCTFKVKYEYKWCEVGTGQFAEIQVLLKNIDILEIDCAEYDQDVDDLYNNPCSSCPTIEDYIFGLEEKIQRLIEEDVF
ncbi:MAG: hypothetical protein IPG79_03205 [Saprospiraceae bacterium]|nr:hypothetical protein [Saprospiraceae bacterium]